MFNMNSRPRSILLVCLLTACSSDPVATGEGDATQIADSGDLSGDFRLTPTSDDFDGDGILNDLEDRNQNGRYDEGTRETDAWNPDTDGDGIPDGVEDANHNGQVDEGETDPRVRDTDGDGLDDLEEIATHGTDPTRADTDGDGISDGDEINTTGTDPNNRDSDNDGLEDGEEDRNGDGIVDETETDPNLQDTDGDGILDAQENIQVACAPSRQPQVILFEDGTGDWLLALPELVDDSGTYGLIGSASNFLRTGYFHDTEGDVFGFIVGKEPDRTVQFGVHQAENETTYLQNIATVSNRRVTPAVSWDLFTAAVVELDLTFSEPLAASTVRDEVTAAMARRPISSLGVRVGTTGPVSTRWHLRFSSTFRIPGRVFMVGALAPAETVAASELVRQQIIDVTDTTILSQYGDQLDQECEIIEVVADQFKVDFLFLVDSSLSMRDDREALSLVATQFFDRLQTTLLDFRIAVATTGMHLDDSWILVEPGFSRAREDFAAQILDPPGATLENGLETGLNIARLARGGATSGGTHARADAKLIVVFVSDEQDQGIDFQVRQGVPGCDPAADPFIPDCPLLITRIEEYLAAEIIGFALTGDMPSGCGEAGGEGPGHAEEPGRGYIQVAYATGGSFGSICSTDHSALLDDIMRAAFGAASTFLLDPPPIAHTIRVVLDGTVLDRSRINGFDYNPAAQSLVFYGEARPDLDSELIVSYRYFLDLTEDPEPPWQNPG
jgi:hypothetical protein